MLYRVSGCKYSEKKSEIGIFKVFIVHSYVKRRFFCGPSGVISECESDIVDPKGHA